jgi:hypothetical protein
MLLASKAHTKGGSRVAGSKRSADNITHRQRQTPSDEESNENHHQSYSTGNAQIDVSNTKKFTPVAVF